MRSSDALVFVVMLLGGILGTGASVLLVWGLMELNLTPPTPLPMLIGGVGAALGMMFSVEFFFSN